MSRTRLPALLGAALVALSCKEGGTQPITPIPTSITVSPATVTLTSLGATQAFTATVRDQNGQPMAGQVLAWSSSATAVATVASTGVATAVANGAATITASVGSAQGTAALTVAQALATLGKTAGDAQAGTVGQALAAALEVEARDAQGSPMAGIAVTFAVTAGGGSVGTPSATTGANGRATTTWTLGTTAGAAQTVSATATGATAAQFSATAVAGAPDTLAITAGAGQAGLPSTPLTDSLRVRVADAFGNLVQGATVDWAVTAGGGSISPTPGTTSATGEAAAAWTLGPSLGTQTATATVAGVSVGSPAQFTAGTLAGSMAIGGGDAQTGLVGYATNARPYVVITSGGSPVPGVQVTFAVASGGGSVTGGVQITDAAGVAQVGDWTLGAGAGTNTLTATADSVANSPLTFTATGATAQYTIELRYLTTPTASQQAAFDSAAARWMRIIYGDLPAQPLNAGAGTCGSNSPAINETIDDVVILVTLEPIDGPGAVLGSAGPCYLRPGNGLPVLGRMRFDTDDLATLETNGQLEDVILHEMAHVLGVGSVLWTNLGFLQNPSLPSSPGVDTHFNGPVAIAAFDTLGGTSYTGGAKVPVENNAAYGAGTRDSHWREDVFQAELMTGIIEAPGTANPLSLLTIASLGDLSYLVNNAERSAYTQVFMGPPAAAAAGVAPGRLLLVDDVIVGPVYIVDAFGRVTRVINP